MELNEKLQILRKQKGLTQEELARELYVSRTAISKWESGRGIPNIESLKAIAEYFSVTVDELLSSDEVLSFAEQTQKRTEARLRDLVFGFSDLCMALLLFLPFFAIRSEGGVRGVSLLALDGVQLYLKIFCLVFVGAMTVWGILTLALQTCEASGWLKCKVKISLVFGMASVLLFVLGLQPYAAAFAFALLIMKVLVLIKRS